MADSNELELAYFAGFFDGEGCVGAYPRRYVVSLTNTDPRPLIRARELWGGFISKQTKESRQFAIQDLWRWQIYGHKSRPFLEAIRPYSKLKCEQIDTYLSILEVLPYGHGQRRPTGATKIIELGAARLRFLKRGGI